MNKIKVIVCSNSAIDYIEYPKEIEIFRMNLHFGSESYLDFVEMPAKEFYQRIGDNPNDIPKTSYTPLGQMLERFDQLEKEGYTDAIVITIARPLSGMCDAIKKIATETKLNVVAYDSRTLAYPEAYMAITAQKMVQNGANLEEILGVLDFIRDNNHMFFTVDTLLYLVKNGRLSKLQGTLGSMLQLKPVLTFSKEGKVETLEKIRTSNKALRRVVELYLEETKGMDCLTFISHAHNDEAVALMTELIHEVYPNREIVSSYLTPVVGAHTGPKAIGLGWIRKQ